MSVISSIDISQNHQYFSQSQNLKAPNSTSEEANESPAEKAAEAISSTSNKLDIYA